MQIRIILVILATFPMHFVQAQQASESACEITSPVDGDNSDRVQMVRFPDGREIMVVGHNHGDREVPVTLNKLINQDQKKVSNEKFLQQLNDLALKVSLAAVHAGDDLAYLRSLLKDRPQLSFVGFEATNQVTQQNLESYAALQKYFYEELSARGIALTEDMQRLILVALGPVYFLKINEPDIFGDRKILGFESEQAVAETHRAEAAAEKAYEEVKKAGGKDKNFMSQIGGTDIQLWSLYTEYNPETDEAGLNAEIEKSSSSVPKAYRDITTKWMKARVVEMTAYKNRERDVAQGMLATGQSGVLLLGGRHLKSIALKLKAKCLSGE